MKESKGSGRSGSNEKEKCEGGKNKQENYRKKGSTASDKEMRSESNCERVFQVCKW